MAKRNLDDGGTPGAQASSGSLADTPSTQFKFDAAVIARMVELCRPTEEWLARQRDITSDPNYGPEQVFAMCARRFLGRKVERIRRADQAQYLENLDRHLAVLVQLLQAYPQFNYTAADPITFLEEMDRTRGKPRRSRNEILTELTEPLLSLRSFAQFQMRALGNERKGSADVIRRRNNYPRFVLIADIIATYQQVTGEEPTAYAADDRHLSPAAELVTLLVPPIMRAAGLAKSQISAQTAKNEIAAIKRLWAEGRRPEMATTMPSWSDLG